jgi:bifunctional ADP-heptose synthase (sugar kinase/adenylyltransferase)
VFTNVASNTLQTFVNGVSIGSVGHSLVSILNTTTGLYIGSYNNGEEDGYWEYYSNGQLRYKGLFKNGELIKKIRYVDDRTNHMFIRIDEGESNIERISKNILENIKWEEYEAVIVSDYCKGFLLEEDIKYISHQHPLTFLDTKKQLNGFADDFTFIKINDVEYSKTKSTILPHLEEKLIVTLGSKGARYQNKTYPVKQVDVRDTSGAGDTFISGLTYKYALSLDIQEAIKFANRCSSQVVQKKGTAKVNINEL